MSVLFNNNISPRVRKSYGKDDRRNSSVLESLDNNYINGFKSKKKDHRPYPNKREAIAFELAVSGVNLPLYAEYAEEYRQDQLQNYLAEVA